MTFPCLNGNLIFRINYNQDIAFLMKNQFFSGLNELRAVAAFGVVVHHIEAYKKRDGIESLFDGALKPFVSLLGKNGVYLFFVLSGFLITYLLLVEINENSKVD